MLQQNARNKGKKDYFLQVPLMDRQNNKQYVQYKRKVAAFVSFYYTINTGQEEKHRKDNLEIVLLMKQVGKSWYCSFRWLRFVPRYEIFSLH